MVDMATRVRLTDKQLTDTVTYRRQKWTDLWARTLQDGADGRRDSPSTRLKLEEYISIIVTVPISRSGGAPDIYALIEIDPKNSHIRYTNPGGTSTIQSAADPTQLRKQRRQQAVEADEQVRIVMKWYSCIYKHDRAIKHTDRELSKQWDQSTTGAAGGVSLVGDVSLERDLRTWPRDDIGVPTPQLAQEAWQEDITNGTVPPQYGDRDPTNDARDWWSQKRANAGAELQPPHHMGCMERQYDRAEHAPRCHKDEDVGIYLVQMIEQAIYATIQGRHDSTFNMDVRDVAKARWQLAEDIVTRGESFRVRIRYGRPNKTWTRLPDTGLTDGEELEETKDLEGEHEKIKRVAARQLVLARQTEFLRACVQGDPESITTLARAGYDTTATCSGGTTALMLAAMSGSAAAVRAASAAAAHMALAAAAATAAAAHVACTVVAACAASAAAACAASVAAAAARGAQSPGSALLES